VPFGNADPSGVGIYREITADFRDLPIGNIDIGKYVYLIERDCISGLIFPSTEETFSLQWERIAGSPSGYYGMTARVSNTSPQAITLKVTYRNET
jgi:hypothetical protein